MQKINGIKGRQLIFSAGGCDGIWVLRLWRVPVIPFFCLRNASTLQEGGALQNSSMTFSVFGAKR